MRTVVYPPLSFFLKQMCRTLFLVVKACMCPLWRDVTAVERSSVCPMGHWHRSAVPARAGCRQHLPQELLLECLQGLVATGISGAGRLCVLAIKEHLGTDGWTDRWMFEEHHLQLGHRWVCGQGRGCVGWRPGAGPCIRVLRVPPWVFLSVSSGLKAQLSCPCTRAVVWPHLVHTLASASVQ